MSANATPYMVFTRHGGANRDFMNQAACRSDNPTPENVRAKSELFFPGRQPGPGSEKAMRRNSAEAKTICATCPVTTDCEDYRIKLDINYGIWGGIAENEREHGGAA